MEYSDNRKLGYIGSTVSANIVKRIKVNFPEQY